MAELEDIEILMGYIFDGPGGTPDLIISGAPQEPGLPDNTPVIWDEERGMWIKDPSVD